MEQRDTVPAAPSTGIQDAPQNFLEALRQWKHYPDNLPSGTESAKLIEDFKRHFGETRGRVLLVPNLKDERLSRVRSGASEVCVHVHDYGTSIMGVMPRDEGGFDNTSRCVCSPGELTELLGLDMHSRPPTQPPDNHKHWAAATPLDFEPREDPVCRLIFLESIDLGSRQQLKITQHMLLQLLTYHQVAPCFLHFLCYLAHKPMTGEGDLVFGGFRALKSFKEPRLNVAELGRSGLHYRLVFELRTMFDVTKSGDKKDDRSTPKRGHGPFSWLRRRDNSAISAQAFEVALRRVTKTIVYHHFDVDNGKSLWIITNVEGNSARKFRDVRQVLSAANRSSISSIKECFDSNLGILTWLVEWSLSEYAFYVPALDNNTEELTGRYFEFERDDNIEKMLTELNRFIESLDECIVSLEANMRVCKALLRFYKRLLHDPELNALNRPWISRHRTELETRIKDAATKIKTVSKVSKSIRRRAERVRQMGSRREDTIQRLLQNRNEQTMRTLSELTRRDSATMRIFAAITLVLLPMSVVSTVFSTDIVTFSPSNASSMSVQFLFGTWSAPAALWWAAATFVATLFVGVIGEVWRRAAVAEHKQRRPRAVRRERSSDLGDESRVRWIAGLFKLASWVWVMMGVCYRWMKGVISKVEQRLSGLALASWVNMGRRKGSSSTRGNISGDRDVEMVDSVPTLNVGAEREAGARQGAV